MTKGPIEGVKEFMYLENVVSTTGDIEQDVEARLGKERLAYRAMDKLCTSQILKKRK